MGAGFKTFTAGSILTASDVQNYLQDQSVMVFGGTAARSSAIGTANFEEGMLTYLTDVDKLQVYTGASFVDVYPPAASAQGLTLINTTSFSAVASQAFPNGTFSATYNNYKILFYTNSLSTNLAITMRLRASGSDATGTNYSGGGIYNYTSGATIGALNYTGQTAFPMGGSGTILNAGAGGRNFFVLDLGRPFAGGETMLNTFASIQDTAGFRLTLQGSLHDLGTAYDSVNFITSTGNMTGVMSVYGYNV